MMVQQVTFMVGFLTGREVPEEEVRGEEVPAVPVVGVVADTHRMTIWMASGEVVGVAAVVGPEEGREPVEVIG